MKSFALFPLFAFFISSLIGKVVSQISCTMPDMVVIKYPKKAVNLTAINAFYQDVGLGDFEKNARRPSRNGKKELEPNLRGGRNLQTFCSSTHKTCWYDDIYSNSWCNWKYGTCLRRDLQQGSESTRVLQQNNGSGEPVDIPAVFDPQLYNCVNKGNTPFADAATTTSIVFPADDVKPDKGRLYHCCKK